LNIEKEKFKSLEDTLSHLESSQGERIENERKLAQDRAQAQKERDEAHAKALSEVEIKAANDKAVLKIELERANNDWSAQLRALTDQFEAMKKAMAGSDKPNESWMQILMASYFELNRYDEAAAGVIGHALRFTTRCTQNHFVSPASHRAVPGDCDPDDDGAPPMGLRVRLAADFDESGFSPIPLAFVKAMKKHGMILADNGSDFFFQSDVDARWTDDLDELKAIPSSAFEAVLVGELQQ
jgi:hypothetical protein